MAFYLNSVQFCIENIAFLAEKWRSIQNGVLIKSGVLLPRIFFFLSESHWVYLKHWIMEKFYCENILNSTHSKRYSIKHSFSNYFFFRLRFSKWELHLPLDQVSWCERNKICILSSKWCTIWNNLGIYSKYK